MNGDLIPMMVNLGFPIAGSVYLLVRLEGKLEVLTQSINNLSCDYRKYKKIWRNAKRKSK